MNSLQAEFKESKGKMSAVSMYGKLQNEGYRVQHRKRLFRVLRQNENPNWYGRRGRIVFTCSKVLPGVGFSQPEWNEIKDIRTGTVECKVTEDFLPGGPCERTIVYEAPFDRWDHEQDYATVRKDFERRSEG